jgi:elongation factor 1 alpha-like protein
MLNGESDRPIENHKPASAKASGASTPKKEGMSIVPFEASHLFPSLAEVLWHAGQQSIGIMASSPDHRSFSPLFTPKDFFSDAPWLNIPTYCQARIVETPSRPRGRLLGGSAKGGKMSKLAALAAKRRQAQEAKADPTGQPVQSDEYAEKLRQLTITRSAPEEKPENTDLDGSRPDDNMDIDEPDDKEEEFLDQKRIPPAGFVQRLQSPPSAFASIVTGTRRPLPQHTHTLLPMDTSTATDAFDFAQPSPDDVFRKAQSKAKK